MEGEACRLMVGELHEAYTRLVRGRRIAAEAGLVVEGLRFEAMLMAVRAEVEYLCSVCGMLPPMWCEDEVTPRVTFGNQED